MSAVAMQPPPQPPPMADHSPLMAVPPSQMVPNLPQPIFTAMAPQYVMQAALTSPFASASPVTQPPRFRKGKESIEHLLLRGRSML